MPYLDVMGNKPLNVWKAKHKITMIKRTYN